MHEVTHVGTNMKSLVDRVGPHQAVLVDPGQGQTDRPVITKVIVKIRVPAVVLGVLPRLNRGRETPRDGSEP